MDTIEQNTALCVFLNFSGIWFLNSKAKKKWRFKFKLMKSSG